MVRSILIKLRFMNLEFSLSSIAREKILQQTKKILPHREI